jgi:hypothetical protein
MISVNVLKNSWQKKEYRNYPVCVMKYLRQASQLSDAEILCWQTLYELAFFSEQWCIQISISNLSQELGKSLKTVCRLLKALESKQYINRKNMKQGGTNLATIIYVRLPDDAAFLLTAQPDRKKYSVIKKYKTIEKIGVTSCVERDIKGYITNDTNNNIINNKLYNNNTSSITNASEKSEPRKQSVVDLFNCMTEKKTRDYHEKMTKIEQKIRCLDGKIQDLYVCSSKLDKKQRNELLLMFEDINTLSAKKNCLENQSTLIRQQAKKTRYHYAICDGQRKLTETQLLKLQNVVLHITGNNIQEARRLCNEIAYSVRFEHLSNKSYRTGMKLSIDESLQIALNLLKKRKWQTPLGLNRCNGTTLTNESRANNNGIYSEGKCSAPMSSSIKI